jgi:hypothetical protein
MLPRVIFAQIFFTGKNPKSDDTASMLLFSGVAVLRIETILIASTAPQTSEVY